MPILEIMLLLKIHGSLAGMLGSGQALIITLGSVIITGVLGARLAQSQGFKIINKIQTKLAAGEIPSHDMIEGIMVLCGGILLLTPGYITDIFGLSFLVPGTRAYIRRHLQSWFQRKVENQEIKVFYSSNMGANRSYYSQDSQSHIKNENVIDVEPTQER